MAGMGDARASLEGSDMVKTLGGRALYLCGVGVCLFSLALLGSPGCGCGTDFTPIGGQVEPPDVPETCCCDFQFEHFNSLASQTVTIEVVSADPSLDLKVTPTEMTVLVGEGPGNFQMCVSDDHDIGANAVLRFTAGIDELGIATFVYSERCRPLWTTTPALQGPPIIVTSEDCGTECCCQVSWVPFSDGTLDDTPVNISISGSGGGLMPSITPTTANVTDGVATTFNVCVDANHIPGAGLTIEIRDQGDNELYSTITLLYSPRCTPSLLTPGGTNGEVIIDDDCNPATTASCCCDIVWRPPDVISGSVSVRLVITAQDKDIDSVTIASDVFDNAEPGVPAVFLVCLDELHDLGFVMTARIEDASNPDIVYAQTDMGYFSRCAPTILESGEVEISVECPGDGVVDPP